VSDPILFDPLAELYERYAEINDGIYRPWLTQAVDAAGPVGPQARAVDLGCWSGRFDGFACAIRLQKPA
jgi:hypothetical protein